MNRVAAVSSALAPGKIILCGEHAVAHGMPAVVQAVPLWTRVDITPLNVRQVEVVSNVGCLKGTWQSSRGWGPDAMVPPALRWVEKLLELLKVPGGWRMEITSELELGSGMGSSASVIAASLVALKRSFNLSLDNQSAWVISKEVESVCHGTSSGIDLAAALFGGMISFKNGSFAPFQSQGLENIYYYFSGKPLDSTQACVAHTKSVLQGNPNWIYEMKQNLEDLIGALGDKPWSIQKELVAKWHRWLKRLGVVPVEVCQQIDWIEQEGGSAKISGAGSLRGPAAGLILVWAQPQLASQLLSKGFELKPLCKPCEGAFSKIDSAPLK